MSDMLTTTTESIPTTIVHSRKGLSIKAPMSQIKIILAVFNFLILVQKVLMTGTPGYTT